MKYSQYRNFVLSKTNGTNIHRINGLLGHVLNIGVNLKWNGWGEEKRKDMEKDLDNAQNEIFKLTNVKKENIIFD